MKSTVLFAERPHLGEWAAKRRSYESPIILDPSHWGQIFRNPNASSGKYKRLCQFLLMSNHSVSY